MLIAPAGRIALPTRVGPEDKKIDFRILILELREGFVVVQPHREPKMDRLRDGVRAPRSRAGCLDVGCELADSRCPAQQVARRIHYGGLLCALGTRLCCSFVFECS